MSENLVSLVLMVAYAPLLLMGLLWIAALGLRLAGKPGFSQWLATRTSIPRPEEPPAPDAHEHKPHP